MVFVDNRPEFVFAVYGALQLGAAVVMCSPAWKARELEHACSLTEPGFVVTDAVGAGAFAAVRPAIVARNWSTCSRAWLARRRPARSRRRSGRSGGS